MSQPLAILVGTPFSILTCLNLLATSGLSSGALISNAKLQTLSTCRFFYAVALPLLLAAILFALRVMPARGTSWLVHADAGLAWFSALSAMVLVPTDVSTTLEVWLWHSSLHSSSLVMGRSPNMIAYRLPFRGTQSYLWAILSSGTERH